MKDNFEIKARVEKASFIDKETHEKYEYNKVTLLIGGEKIACNVAKFDKKWFNKLCADEYSK